MIKEIIGTKRGMTRIYDEQGNIVPVTLVQAGPCPITAIRTKEKDGYDAVQLGFGECKEKNVNKPLAGIFKAANVKPLKHLIESRVDTVDGLQLGQEIKLDIFKKGDFIDITGVSKGKGFAGVIKRYNFGGGPKTHGQSDYQRHRGASAGQRPQRVLPGTRMAGHMGDATKTVQRLQVIDILLDKNMLLVKGSVPGTNDGLLVIRHTMRKMKPKSIQESERAKPKGKGKAPKEAPKKKK